ncbi:conserved hypothetical protein [endosymbiont of unidentified scaly snail isolate Monju]|nr:conserved hypothetical protein [endosymbiont of unidentified scaly snail isolate Monju]
MPQASNGDSRQAELKHALAAAVHALNRQDFGRAKAIIDEVRKHFPSHPDALHLAGYIQLVEGKPDDAIGLIRQAIRKAPKVGLYHYNLGMAYFMKRELEKARDAFQATIRLDPKSRDAIDNLAIVQHELKRLREAEVLFEQAVKISPEDPRAWLNLAKIRMELRKPRQVDEAVARAAELADAEDGDFLHEVGKIYYGLSRHELAERYFRRAIEKTSEDPLLFYALGKVLGERGEYGDAEEALKKARELGASIPKTALALADLYVTSGEIETGRGALDEAVEQGGDDPDILLEAAQTLSLIGDFDLQEALLQRILKKDPENVAARVHLAFVPKRKLDDTGVAFMEKRIDDPAIDAKVRTSMGFALGNHYRNIKEYDKAFRYYKRGNQLKGYSWDRLAYRGWVDRTLKIYSRSFFEERADWGLDSRLPVLIVGMPRSGTTLTEQIVSAHSAVHGAGEFGAVTGLSAGPGLQVPRILDEAESILAVDAVDCEAMARNHLARLEAQARHGESFVTNKLPHNFQLLGLFALEFPCAPVIHIRRDPRDNLLSIYFQDFGGYHPYAYDLKNLAFQYWEQERLMSHWKSLIPNPVFTLDYEKLVTDLEGMIHRLAAFLGITVEDAMKRFYEQERQVQTASKWQVRQKLYSTSIGRWKPYEKHLRPLFEALREFKPDDIPDEYGLFEM